jgi:hypothetical protein
MGVSSIEERKTTCCLSPKIYQPAENMDGLIEFPRKKKMFSSSSFYEEPNAVYPTIEEQVQLCRKIAESLSDDCNVKSKGANMFFKRVKKAEKWIVAESNVQIEEESSEKDPSKMPYVRPHTDGPTRLKLILDPRHIVDMQRLIKEGVDIVKHDIISPEVCHDLVKDLNSPTGRGAQLFAKRKKKSEEWIVDDEKVKHLLETRYSGEYTFPEPNMPPLTDINSQKVVETVIRAAESKVMTYPNAVPQMSVIESLDGTRDWVKSQPLSDAYKFSAPKGWTSNTSASPLPVIAEAPVMPTMTASMLEDRTSTTLPQYSSSLRRTQSFNNFNSSPRAWNPEMFTQFRPVDIKRVKPPSVLVQ